MAVEQDIREPKFFPERTYTRHCELTPQTAEEIADLFSLVTSTPSAKGPLNKFLMDLNEAPPGFAGVALAFWYKDSPNIAAYMVIDEDPENPQRGSLTATVIQIHTDFAISMREINGFSGGWMANKFSTQLENITDRILKEMYEPLEDSDAIGPPGFFIVAKKQPLQSDSL